MIDKLHLSNNKYKCGIMKTYKTIYGKVISELCREAELTEDDLACSRDEKCVELRRSLVSCMNEYGLKEKEICETTGFSQPAVNRYLNFYRDGHKPTFTMTVFKNMIKRIIQREIESYSIDSRRSIYTHSI